MMPADVKDQFFLRPKKYKMHIYLVLFSVVLWSKKLTKIICMQEHPDENLAVSFHQKYGVKKVKARIVWNVANY